METNINRLWNKIEEIRQVDIEYDKFRSRTREFIVVNSMTNTEFSLNCRISLWTLIWFLNKGYRRLSSRTISKMYNFMEDYKR